MLHINVATLDGNPWTEHNPFRAWYELTTKNEWGLIGLRDDGIGDQGKWWLASNPITYGSWRRIFLYQLKSPGKFGWPFLHFFQLLFYIFVFDIQYLNIY